MAYSYQSSIGSRGLMGQIYNIFGRHSSSRFDQRWEADKAIDDWRRDLVKQIDDYATEQKRIIEQTFKDQDKYFDDMREDFVATSIISERNEDAIEIDRLLRKCRTLKMELVELSFHSVDKQFIRFTPIKPSERMDQEELNSSKNGDGKVEQRSTQRTTTDSVLDTGLSSNSYSTSASATPTRMK